MLSGKFTKNREHICSCCLTQVCLSFCFSLTLHPIWHLLSFAFFLCSKIFRLCDLMLVHTHIVLTKCTTWPQKHTTWSTTGYIKLNFFFFPLLFVTYHPHESLSAFLESCQNLNAVCSCYIPLFFGTVLIFLCVLMIDSFLFLFSSFVKKKNKLSTLYIIYGIKHPNAYVWNFTCGFSFFIVKHVPLCS